MNFAKRDHRKLQIEGAVKCGRLDHAEGVRFSENPFTDPGLREAWQVGWNAMTGQVALKAATAQGRRA